MKKMIFAIGIFSGAVSVAFANIPGDLKKITETNECVRCDMTNYKYTWTRLDIKASNLKGSFWTKSYLRSPYTSFAEKELENANFALIDGYEVVFNKSNLKNASFKDSILRRCSFNETILSGVDFSLIDAEKTQFTNAHLNDSTFEGAKCIACNLMFTDLTDVNFKNAKLDKVNFYGSNLTNEQLKMMESYSCATLPDGSVFDNNGEINCGE